MVFAVVLFLRRLTNEQKNGAHSCGTFEIVSGDVLIWCNLLSAGI